MRDNHPGVVAGPFPGVDTMSSYTAIAAGAWEVRCHVHDH